MIRLHRLACALFAAFALISFAPSAADAASVVIIDDGDSIDVAAADIAVFAAPFTTTDATFAFLLTASSPSQVHVAFDAAFLGATSAAVSVAAGADGAMDAAFSAASPTLGFSFDIADAASRQVSLTLSDVLGLGLTPQLSFTSERLSVTPIGGSAPYLLASLIAFAFLGRRSTRS